MGPLGYYSYYSGFDGTWAELFNKAYNSIFAYDKRKSQIVSLILDKVEKKHISRFNAELLEDFILQIHNDFLGCSEHNKDLFYTYECFSGVNSNNNCRKKCFKKILLDMYSKDSNYYSEICVDRQSEIKGKSVNELRGTFNNYTKNGMPQININELLNNMYNFSAGFDSIMNELVDYFLSKLKNRISNNNTENLKKFVNYHEEFRNMMLQLNKKIKENVSISSNTNLGDMLAEIAKVMNLD